MLDKNSFSKIREQLEKFEEAREQTIQDSRKVIKLSKQIIYGLHRGDDVEQEVEQIKQDIKKLEQEKNYDTGIAGVAFQEYVEALCYHSFIKHKKIPSPEELGVDAHSYLLGLCDLSGELVRKAVASAITNEEEKVLAIKGLVEELYGEFLKFDLRNGDLRKKSDSIKWNLNKLQDLTYNLKKERR